LIAGLISNPLLTKPPNTPSINPLFKLARFISLNSANLYIKMIRMTNSIAIKTIGLTKEFVRNKRVIDDVNLNIKKGELFCLIGSNGAGKTTLIKILCNLILPTKGDIFINGCNVLHEPEKVRSFIGLVTGDERSFYWRLTGRQNMEFFAALYNLSSEVKDVRIKELFKVLDIKEPDKVFQEYSSGIKQKLSIARALLNDPAVLFMDELTKNLDPTSANDLRSFIKEKLIGNHNKTVVFSTHHLQEVEYLADRIAFMVKGRIVATGTIEELRGIIGRRDATIEQIYNYFIDKKG